MYKSKGENRRTLQQFYQTKRWRDTRRQVLRRDLFTCQSCGMWGNEVHHIQALTIDNVDDWDVALNPANLETLCKSCHSKETVGAVDVVEGYMFDDDGQISPLSS